MTDSLKRSVFSLVKRLPPSVRCAMRVKPSTASFASGLAERPRPVVESQAEDDHEPTLPPDASLPSRHPPKRGDPLWSRASSPAAGLLRPEPGRASDELDPGDQNDGDMRPPGPAAAVRVPVVHRRVRLDLRGVRSVRRAPAIVVPLGWKCLQLDLSRLYRRGGGGPDVATARPGRDRVRSPIFFMHGHRGRFIL